MRPAGDRRPARLFKIERLRQLAPAAIAVFIDDDPEVVAAARAVGISTVLADWVPRGVRLHVAQEAQGRT
jgi:FMN phosphatase YigB (HAD superfamily)